MPLSEVRRPQGCGFGLWGSQSDARYSCGQHLMFIDYSAVFSELRFSVPAPESHRSVALLTLYRRGFRKVISHSDGHSIVRSTLCPHTNQLGNYFRFERRFFVIFLLMNMKRQKKPVHSTSNQREMISRSIFDETMYRLCYSETFNVCFFRSAGRPCNGAAQPQSLSAAALCFISDIQLWVLL